MLNPALAVRSSPDPMPSQATEMPALGPDRGPPHMGEPRIRSRYAGRAGVAPETGPAAFRPLSYQYGYPYQP